MPRLARSSAVALLMASWGGGVFAASPQPGQALRDCAECPELVVLQAGAFDMGSSAEERRREGVPDNFGNRELPRHRVTIARPFAMARTEITRGQYARFVAQTKRPVVADCIVHDRQKDTWTLRQGSWQNPGFEQTDDDPVVCMSWADGRDYAAWLARSTGKRYRLPSEAEWEYAARAGTATARYWGDTPRPVCEKSNVMSSATFADLGSPRSWQGKLICSGLDAWTRPVGSFAANPFGLSDLYGNVWEWVADCAHDSYEGSPADGRAWDEPACKGRVVRGGAFHSEFWLVRSATRGVVPEPDGHPVASGFRIARDLD